MSTRKLSALVVSGLVLGGGFVTSPSVSARSSHDDHFTLAADITDVEKDDRGEDGPSKGDKFTFDYKLFDRDGDKVGDGTTTCKLVEVDRRHREFKADCEGVLDLDDGKLELEGTVTDEDFEDREVVLEVVDGTRDFADAEGKATFRPARDGHGKGHGHGRDHARDRKHHDRNGHDRNGHDLKIEVDLK